MTSDHNHGQYRDEDGRYLHIDRIRVGSATVTATDPVSVLAEHVPEVCRQLADKAGVKVVILATEGTEQGEVSVVSDGGKGWYQVDSGSLGVALSGPQLLQHHFTARQARTLGAALGLHADRADKAAENAEVIELAQVIALRAAPPGSTGNYYEDVARAVLAAGYRKAGP